MRSTVRGFALWSQSMARVFAARRVGILAGLLVVGLLLPSTGAAAPDRQVAWKAGTARAKITPEKPLWLAGYSSRERPAEGKLHDLWIKVLALEDARGERVVLVTSDLLGFTKPLAEAVCADALKEFGLRRAQIMLTASHTHSGPVLSGALLDIYPLDEKQMALIDEYTAGLQKTVVKTIGEALGRLAPATLADGEGKTGFAANRRMNSEKDVIKLRQEGKPTRGPSDHRVPVLAVRSTEGRLLAVVFLYACHNTTLADYLWCGDYAGFAQIALEEKHPDALAMFVSGCGADQNPLPRRTVDLCRKYGEALAEAVETVLARPMKPAEPSLQASFDLIHLSFHGDPPADRWKKEAAQSNYAGRYARRMLKLLADAQAGDKPLPTSYPYPVQVWRVGNEQLWIALGGEVVVDYALSFASKFGPTTWVIGYANDVMGYIPSARVLKEGGYESGAFSVYGVPADRWADDIEKRITEATQRLVAKAREKGVSAKPPVAVGGNK